MSDATSRLTDRLLEHFGPVGTALAWQTPFQLLIATMLSAQSTDRAVNLATPSLFARWPTPKALAEADLSELEGTIATIGLYRTKARHIRETCRLLMELHGGEVPADREALTSLPGVGRKTANVVLSVAFGIPALAVDTHVQRVSHRLGLASGISPARTEEELCALFPPGRWGQIHHLLIHLGRSFCSARTPRCGECPVAPLCPRTEASGSAVNGGTGAPGRERRQGRRGAV